MAEPTVGDRGSRVLPMMSLRQYVLAPAR